MIFFLNTKKHRNLYFIIICITIIITILYISIVNRELFSFKNNFVKNQVNSILLLQQDNGCWGKLSDADPLVTASVVESLKPYNSGIDFTGAYLYLFSVLKDENKWNNTYQKEKAERSDKEIIRHYNKYLTSLSALLASEKGKDPILKQGIEKLISEQEEDGSFANEALFTSQAVLVLNSYYSVTKDEKIIKSIVNACNYLKNELERSNFDKVYLGLCSYALLDTTHFNDIVVINKLLEEYNQEEFDPYALSYIHNVFYFMLKTDYLEDSKKSLIVQKILFTKDFREKIKNNEVTNKIHLVNNAKLLKEAKNYVDESTKSEIDIYINCITDLLVKSRDEDDTWTKGPAFVPSPIATLYNTATLFKSFQNIEKTEYLKAGEKGLNWLDNFYSFRNLPEEIDLNAIPSLCPVTQLLKEVYKCTGKTEYNEIYKSILDKCVKNWNPGENKLIDCYLISMISDGNDIIEIEEKILENSKKAADLLANSQDKSGEWQIIFYSSQGDSSPPIDITFLASNTLFKAEVSGLGEYETFVKKGLNHLKKSPLFLKTSVDKMTTEEKMELVYIYPILREWDIEKKNRKIIKNMFDNILTNEQEDINLKAIVLYNIL